MIRRILSILILISMILHCSSRLGVLSYLYSNRMDIAHTLGMLQETPIATCNSNYFADKNLTIHAEDGDRLPAIAAHAAEINLFCSASPPFFLQAPFVTINSNHGLYISKHYTSALPDIVHPPA